MEYIIVYGSVQSDRVRCVRACDMWPSKISAGLDTKYAAHHIQSSVFVAFIQHHPPDRIAGEAYECAE